MSDDKPKEIAKLIPDTITECAIHASGSKTCSTSAAVAIIKQEVKSKHTAPEKVIADAKAHLNCSSEYCVVNKLAAHNPILSAEKAERFKVKGHTDSKWLSNVHIDAIGEQWERQFATHKSIPFAMLDFEEFTFINGEVIHRPAPLALVDYKQLYDAGIRTVSCVVNTDYYHGPGKHWEALFVDMRAAKLATVEFFNSAGPPPPLQYNAWMQKTKLQLEQFLGAGKVKAINVSGFVHQRSDSECGVYSLFYIWSRLNNVPADYFLNNRIKDKWMFEFRQHLFLGDDDANNTKFDWEAYQKKVPIKWVH